jgi:hypothetical protein
MKAKRRTRLHMLLSDDEASALAEICVEHDCTMSDAVRMLIQKEVVSWQSDEAGARWRDDRWRDERWPKRWPKGAPKRQVGERFYDFQARRHDARMARLAIEPPPYDEEPGPDDHPRADEPRSDGDEPRADKPPRDKPGRDKPGKPRADKPRGDKPPGAKSRASKGRRKR